MSMRSRGAAAAATSRRTRGVARPVYEDFKPISEWKHENGADILCYQLPGFVKEQIRIIAESRGVLKVRGERLVAGNKWSRFQEEVVVPEDCNMSEIRAKFEGGALQIIMPKRIVATTKTNTIDEETDTTQDSSQSGRANTKQKPQDVTPKVSTPRNNMKEPEKPRNNEPYEPQSKKLDELSATFASKVGDDLSQPKMSEYDHDYGHAHDKSEGAHAKEMKSKGDSLYNLESKDYATHKEFPSSITKDQMLSTNEDFTMNAKERQKLPSSSDNQNFKGKELVERYKDSDDQKVTNTYTTKRLLDEDWQLVMNMGAAILVIMALAACVTYSFGYSD